MQTNIGYEMWNDGSQYNGTYLSGKKDGIGTYLWSDKTFYQGEWKENNIHGYGIYYFSDGRIYMGEWKVNQMNGFGKFIWKEEGNVIKFGLWNYGKKEKNFDEEEFFINVDKSNNEKKYIYYYKMDINEIKNFMEIY